MNNKLIGKKLLLLGGAAQHCKVVAAAREMGLTVYVTDYLPLEKAPAKQLADVPCYLNFSDVDRIVEFCKNEHIDGVLNVNFEAPQKCYREVCKKLELPCFGTEEQYDIFTNKSKFKECCKRYGVDTITEYTEAEITSDFHDYPILVKPAVSHGSRGISICREYADMDAAFSLAREESETREVLIEKYMDGYPDFSMTYLVIDGEPVLVRTVDRFLGSKKDKMNRSCIVSVGPSYFLESYYSLIHPRIVAMIKALGIQNAPIFMQGFIDGGTVRFYDPGLRYSGSDYERLYEKIYGISIVKPLIHYALTGSMGIASSDFPALPDLNGHFLAQPILMVGPGKISRLDGIGRLRTMKNVIAAYYFYNAGDEVGAFYNAKQKLGEVDFIADSLTELLHTLEEIYTIVTVKDETGSDMLISKASKENIERFYRIHNAC